MVEPRRLWGGLGNRMFQMAHIYAQARSGEIPDIYVQDEKYFESVKEEIKTLYGQDIQPIDMVSLHIRRGDYINNPFYVNLGETDYYEEAINQFPDEKFLVFYADRQGDQKDVNDRQWCIDFLDMKGINYEMWYGGNEIEDFNAMAGCKAHIIANSSFSWMAAYVGGGKTVAPKRWFANGLTGISLPETWISL